MGKRKNRQPRKNRVMINLTDEELQKLDALAEAHDRERLDMVRHLINKCYTRDVAQKP